MNRSETDSDELSIENFVLDYFKKRDSFEILECRLYQMKEAGAITEAQLAQRIKTEKKKLYRRVASKTVTVDPDFRIDLLRPQYPRTFQVLSVKRQRTGAIVDVKATEDRWEEYIRLTVIEEDGEWRVLKARTTVGTKWVICEI